MKKIKLTSDPRKESLDGFVSRIIRDHGFKTFINLVDDKLKKASTIEGYTEYFDYNHKNFYLVLERMAQVLFPDSYKCTTIGPGPYKRKIEFVNGSEFNYIGGK